MNRTEFFRKSQFVLLIALGCYPAAVMAALFTAPQLLPYSWIYPVIYGVAGICGMLVPGKPRLIFGILGTLAMVVPALLFFDGTLCWFALLLAVAYSALLFCTMRIGAWEAGKELPAGWLACMLALLLIGCFLSFVEEKVAHTAIPMKVSLFVFAFFAMRSLNRGSLFLAAGGKRSFSPSMISKNTILTIALFVIALGIALLPSAVGFLKTLLGWLGDLINWLKELFASLVPEETVGTIATMATTEPENTAEGLGVITERIPRREVTASQQIMMTSIVLAVLIPAGIIGLFKISKLLIKGIKGLISMVDTAVNAQTDDYEDEITDTRQDGHLETKRNAREKKDRTPESSMTPGERIRYRYRRLAKKHPEWQDCNTARENLPEMPAELYERARYSDHPITPEEAEQFKQETK